MCAALLHAALIIGVTKSSPRRMGEPNRDPNALNVDLVDAADFMNATTAPVHEESTHTDSREAAQPAEQSAGAHAEQQFTPWSLDKQALESFPPSGAVKPGASQPQQRPGLSLQLSPPQEPLVGAGRSASVGRPANITRSGENDEFGRGVVRALRQTMPRPNGTAARITIRLFLSETGNLADLVLVRSSGDPHMDQSVMFAAKQSSFPIPPAGSTLSDRTFLVTYIYR